ncbi:ATP-NAD kinase family protein [Clostridium sp. Cult2]|uniref:ATP-NAD kinase family protein n=1 Tax=Clostridium sp. Cult2 TaxID=2079003 RepID=UPI001F2030BF|nr:ATP-NAD kinase family protein [Clostridium sp. Cult2]MCF6465262.1 ATP-NAD kinase [Clostridium sp. Cult2]
MKLGFIVNPIAGMGGKVGLKGTDGEEVLEKAIELGAFPESPNKAKKALEMLIDIKNQIELITGPGSMGEEEAKELGFNPKIVGTVKKRYSSEDTEIIATEMVHQGIDLLLFAGGDGTARNIFNAIGDRVPVIGIPAGVKIHSGVYANHPKSAGEIALKYLQGREIEIKEMEVMDIDEDAFRMGQVTAKLYGYMKVPFEPGLVQNQKSGGIMGEEAALDGISDKIIEQMEEDVLYIIGSGTSTRPIMEKLELPNTLLGIDIVKNKKLVASDVNEKDILRYIEGNKAKIIVTVIGGQGYIFGRGNQQISGDVIKKVGKENIIIIASKQKLMSLNGRPLMVDTGDDEINNMFNGYMKVRTSYTEEAIHMVKGL